MFSAGLAKKKASDNALEAIFHFPNLVTTYPFKTPTQSIFRAENAYTSHLFTLFLVYLIFHFPDFIHMTLFQLKTKI